MAVMRFSPVKSDIADSLIEGYATGTKIRDRLDARRARELEGKALTGDFGAIQSLAGLDPQAYKSAVEWNSLNNHEQAALVGKMAVGADTPEKWSAMVEQGRAMGIPFEDDDADFANRPRAISGAAAVIRNKAARERAASADLNAKLAVKQAGQKRTLTKSYDANGNEIRGYMDGDRFVQVGGAKKAKGGQVIEIGPNGEVRIGSSDDIAKVGNAITRPLGKAATNELEKDAAQAEQLLGQVDKVEKLADPQFLTYMGKASQWLTGVGDKLSDVPILGEIAKPTAEQKDFLAKYTQFKQETERLFNMYRIFVTGAAAPVKELEILRRTMVNSDLSPTQFKAAVDAYKEEVQLGLQIRKNLLTRGLTISDPQYNNEFERAYLQLKGRPGGGGGTGGVTPGGLRFKVIE